MNETVEQETYQHAKNVSWRSVGSEAVLINLDTSAYFTLNEMGALIWEELGQGQTAEGVAAAILRQYAADGSEVRRHVQDLIGRLLDAELLTRAPTPMTRP